MNRVSSPRETALLTMRRLVVEPWRDAVRDVRYAARMLAHAPGFTVAAVICLAIGIGLTAAMYSQIQSTVFREIPGVRDAAALVRLQRPMSLVYFEDLRDDESVFSSLAAYMGPVPVVVNARGDQPYRVWGHIATPAYFDVLGTRATLGRMFGAEERTAGGHRQRHHGPEDVAERRSTGPHDRPRRGAPGGDRGGR